MADIDSIGSQVISLFRLNLPDKIGDTVSQFNIQQHLLYERVSDNRFMSSEQFSHISWPEQVTLQWEDDFHFVQQA